MKKLLLVLFTISNLGLAFSQSLVEPFSYGASIDTLTNPANAGTVWKSHSGAKGSFTNSLVYINSSLSYAGYPTSGNGGSVEVYGTTRTEDGNRELPAFTSGSVYASCLVRVDSVLATSTTGDYFFHFADTFGTGAMSNLKGRVFIKMGSTPQTFKIGLSKGGTGAVAVFTSTDYAFGTTLLIVLKYKFDLSASANDSTFLHVFSSGVPLNEPSVATLVSTDNTSSDLVRVRSICLRQGSAANFRAVVDGIRVSDSWANGPLPVQIKSFTASNSADGNMLKWLTASEVNNQGFEVLRSINNSKYQQIGFVKGVGNSNSLKHYSFRDVTTERGNICYKLRQVDYNGNSNISRTSCVVVEAEHVTKITSAPNPFNSELGVQINYSTADIAQITLVDLIGKTHYSGTKQVNHTTDKIYINTQDIPNGIYFVRVVCGAQIFTQKVVKK